MGTSTRSAAGAAIPSVALTLPFKPEHKTSSTASELVANRQALRCICTSLQDQRSFFINSAPGQQLTSMPFGRTSYELLICVQSHQIQKSTRTWSRKKLPKLLIATESKLRIQLRYPIKVPWPQLWARTSQMSLE